MINSKTASLGEFVTIVLKSQGNTKIFGSESQGMTTGLKIIGINSDGTVLFFSDTFICDSDKNIIKGSIIPDVKCEQEESLTKAIEWIENAI